MNDMTRSKLDEIRQRIDDLDRDIHSGLMQRSDVIEDLIQVKAASSKHGDTGPPFRPVREAEIARRLALRHAGQLPLVTIEHIWREVITSFTAMQSPFSLILAPNNDSQSNRDLARFYFGFSVPIIDVDSAHEAISHLKSKPRDLAIVELSSQETWWDGLGGAEDPVILARIPFMEGTGPAHFPPSYVIGPKTPDFDRLDILVCKVEAVDGLSDALAPVDGRIVQSKNAVNIVEIPAITGLSGLETIIANLGMTASSIVQIGAIAAPMRLLADGGSNSETSA